jgi:hypothetical protein
MLAASIAMINNVPMMEQLRRWLNVLCFTAMAALSTPVCAQTTEQFDRINTLTHYGMVMAWCDKLGMKLSPNWDSRIEHGINAEVQAWGLPRDTAKQLVSEAVTRQSRLNKIDLDAITEQQTKTEAGLRSVSSVFRKYGSQCLDAGREPRFFGVIKVPANFD